MAPRSRTPEAVFRAENVAQRILDGGGAAPHTQRATPGSAGEPDADLARKLFVVEGDGLAGEPQLGRV